MTLDEAIRVLRQHNVTGASVLRITKGKALEKDLLAQMLDSCEQLISEKAEYKRLLKSATGIIKDVDCNEDYLCNECEYRAKCDGGFSFYWRYANEALALIGEDTNVGHKSGGWISVKDRLPEDTEPCAVVTENNGLGVSRLMGRNELEWTLFGEPVLYWQPLPEPPKDGDAE